MVHVPGVFVFVTIDAQVLPVTAIGRVVVVVMVFVVDCELVKVLPSKLTTATGADPRMNLERLLPVSMAAVVAFAMGARDKSV